MAEIILCLLELFAQACRLGLEGVVSKRVASKYRMTRSSDWIKAKRYDVGRFEVVGFTTKASPRHVASLILADPITFAPAGKVSNGLTNHWSAELFDGLLPLRSDKSPTGERAPKGGTWIAPGKITAEVTHRGRTDSGAVRQASLLSVDLKSVPDGGTKNC